MNQMVFTSDVLLVFGSVPHVSTVNSPFLRFVTKLQKSKPRFQLQHHFSAGVRVFGSLWWYVELMSELFHTN